MAEQKEILDVAIVGGGISGVYSGWRILTSPRVKGSGLSKIVGSDSHTSLKVSLFEGSKRIGGRLLSVTPPGIPDARVEIGGMRFTDKHYWVDGLVKHLELKTRNFPVAEPQNMGYFRGKHLRQHEVLDPDKIPYNLPSDDSDASLLSEGFTAVAAQRLLRIMMQKDVDLKTVNWQEVAENYQFEGEYLHNLPFRYVLNRMLSHEAFQYNMETSGYDSILFTWNAADGFPWNLADFGLEVTYYALEAGYETVPHTVGQLFEDAGGQIHFDKWLRSFDKAKLPDGSEGFALRFASENAGPGDPDQTVYARSLILAMPRRSLELLNPSGVLLDPSNEPVQDLIKSVTPIPLFKLAVCYPFPWWETLPEVEVDVDGAKKMVKITEGESVTDLPIRQCYYWAVDPTSKRAVVLIYDDGLDLEYWQNLRNLKADHFQTHPDHVSEDDQDSKWDKYKAPPSMVDEIHRQLKEIHGVTDRPDIPEPYAAAYRDWGDDPFGGGANFWHIGVKSHEVSKAIVHPMENEPVFICGESYSHEQGWAEGALKTAEDMLQNHMGLESPYWYNGPPVE